MLPPLRPSSAHSSRFSEQPPPCCQSEGEACSYKRAWLGGPATPGPRFQRAGSWKEGRTARGAGMPREDINSAFLSGFRSSPLFSFSLFPPGRVRREPTLQRENFPGACVEGCSLLVLPTGVINTRGCYYFWQKKWSLLKKTTFHLLSRLLMKLLVWGGWGGWQPKKPGPLQKNGRATSAGQGQAGGLLLARPTLILVFCPPPLCTPLLWQARRGARASTERGGTEKDCQFNSRKPTVWGRIRRALGLGLRVWGWEETWRLKARAS